MRFSANVSILYTQPPFLDRFECAARSGFRAVEFWWPSSDALARVVDAVRDANVEVALMNFEAGDIASGDRGLLSDPAREDQFRANVPVALDLAQRTGCSRLNALVGRQLSELTREEQLELARANVTWAADEAAEIGASILIEAVNTFESDGYLLSRTHDVADFIQSVGRPNVEIQYDVYHMQRMEGHLAATLSARIGEIGHIQIADAPGRHEPGTGEINFGYIFKLIDELGYRGYVGLEYRPSTGSTEDSLHWLEPEARGFATEPA